MSSFGDTLPVLLPQDVQVIHNRCSDPSLAVRKQAMACLTAVLLHKREDAEVRRLVGLGGGGGGGYCSMIILCVCACL